MLIPALLAAALLSYVLYRAPAARGSGMCEVVANGHTVMTVSLGEDRVFSPPGLPEVEIEVRDGAAAFIRSDCHDKICVRSGYLRESGQMAACLPNRVAIRITRGSGGDGPDVVI